jgi:hypothetical protein
VSRTRARIASVFLPAAQAEGQRIRPIPAVVAQQLGVLAVVGDEQVEVAVVVDVTDREPTADLLGGESWTRRAPNLDEAAQRRITEQELPLVVRGPRAELRGVSPLRNRGSKSCRRLSRRTVISSNGLNARRG